MKRPLVPVAGQACIKLGTEGEGEPSPALAGLLISEPGVGYRLAVKNTSPKTPSKLRQERHGSS